MKNISEKFTTLRTARAEATIRTTSSAVAACKLGRTPKGNVIDVARTAGIMAAKRTSELIPFCHPIPIDHAAIDISCKGREITIISEVTSVAKTGVEMEALTSANIAALTVYDMLKPIETDIQIRSCRLLEKHGGKSDHTFKGTGSKKAAILIPSDAVLSGSRKDLTGPFIYQWLKNMGPFKPLKPVTVPNDQFIIEETLRGWCNEGIDVIITSGGTGPGPRDRTAVATKGLIDKDMPGISERLRAFGSERTPFAALSGGVAGLCGRTLIVNLPGSLKGVKESLTVLRPILLHACEMMDDRPHK